MILYGKISRTAAESFIFFPIPSGLKWCLSPSSVSNGGCGGGCDSDGGASGRAYYEGDGGFYLGEIRVLLLSKVGVRIVIPLPFIIMIISPSIFST